MLSARSRADASGFTIVEMVIAILILTFGVLGLAASAGQFLTYTDTAEVRYRAMQAADDRLSMVLIDPNYDTLGDNWAGSESDLEGFEDFTRVTEVDHVVQQGQDGRIIDYKVITVTVSGDRLENPVVRTAVMGAP